jgi:hypothetical protein
VHLRSAALLFTHDSVISVSSFVGPVPPIADAIMHRTHLSAACEITFIFTIHCLSNTVHHRSTSGRKDARMYHARVATALHASLETAERRSCTWVPICGGVVLVFGVVLMVVGDGER